MALRKLRLEIHRGVENGECNVNLPAPQWQGQPSSIITNEISGSVMKIVIRDSNEKLISITIDKNGTIHTINDSNLVDSGNKVTTKTGSTNSENEHGGISTINHQSDFDETCSVNLDIVKNEVEEWQEENAEQPVAQSSISFETVLGVISEGYSLETSEGKIKEEFIPEIKEIKVEQESITEESESTYVDDSASRTKNYEASGIAENSEFCESMFETYNYDTIMPLHCRLCATQRKDMMPLFANNEAYCNILDKIEDCLPITIRETDALPKQVCRLCLEKLELCHKFYKVVVEAEEQLLAFSGKLTEESRNTDEYNQPSTTCTVNQSIKSPIGELEPNREESSNKLSSFPRTNSSEFVSTTIPFPEENNAEEDTVTVGRISIDKTLISQSKDHDYRRCRICGTYFDFKQSAHSEHHSLQNYYPCCLCDISFQTRSERLIHSVEHANPTAYKNNLVTPDHNELVVHNTSSIHAISTDNQGKSAVEEQSFITQPEVCDIIKCRISGEFSGGPTSCHKHSLVHVSELNYPCCICDKTFTNGEDYYLHSFEHNSLNIHGKDMSNRNLSSVLNTGNQQFSNHMEVLSEKVIENQTSSVHQVEADMVKCRICGKYFGSPGSCYKHSEVHMVESNYPCCICNKTFTNRADCYIHSFEHISLNEKVIENQTSSVHQVEADMVKCRICGKYFGSPGSCYKHSEVHMAESNYPCCICNETFTNRADCYLHSFEHKVRRPHLKDRIKNYLSSVSNTENQQCSNDVEISSENVDKNQTSSIHEIGEDMVKCRICGKYFGTPRSCYKHSEEVHVSLSYYPCCICDKTFTNQRDCYLHSVQHKLRSVQGNRKLPSVHEINKRKISSCTDKLSDEDDENQTSYTQKIESDMMKCRICGKVFGSARNSHDHSGIHATKSFYPCCICDESFTSEVDSFIHSFKHFVPDTAPKRKKLCNETPAGSDIPEIESGDPEITEKNLKQKAGQNAVNILSERVAKFQIQPCEIVIDNLIKCRICRMYFETSRSCYIHSKVHASEYNYPCSMCDKTFTIEEAAALHQLDHEKPKHNSKASTNTDKKVADLQPIVLTRSKKLSVEIEKESGPSPRVEINGNKIRCKICELLFPDIETCYIHSRIHASEKSYPCCVCDKVLPTRMLYKRHCTEHGAWRLTRTKRKPPCLCTVCGKRFNTERRLKFHQIYHDPEKKSGYCEKCNKNMGSEYSLYRHTLSLHVEKDNAEYNCTACGKKFSNRSALYGHQWIHKKHTLECDTCKVKFYSDDQLNAHKKLNCTSSSSGKNYSCFYCGRTFPHKYRLINHLRRHTGERPHSCNYCLRTFYSNRGRDKHQLKHFKKTSMKCAFCEKRFSNSDRLKEHEDTHHLSETDYDCNQCNESFKSIALRSQHLLAVHAKR